MLDIDTAIPLGLILNELLTNSLKYAFPTAYGCGPANEKPADLETYGRDQADFQSTSPRIDKFANKTYIIAVKFRKISDKFMLIIKDNGIGFPQDLDYKKTGTLGLELVNRLTKQIDGIIELDTSNGTEFKITFKELEIRG